MRLPRKKSSIAIKLKINQCPIHFDTHWPNPKCKEYDIVLHLLKFKKEFVLKLKKKKKGIRKMVEGAQLQSLRINYWLGYVALKSSKKIKSKIQKIKNK